ncbi:universal stress protein [Adhaeribacter rhizoryzae]|uniref:Universal stress protein n=1 Tax=Adhaeribacter rhizoryzae TaxID=2607907 RepID=A0A5M6CXM7_9BACT|nr:universal stress protein [Adhaeribacter rhizoryzae]KAA5539951.1 universal stress protein [Adhaeribacter rhizoryzae]
MKTILVATDYSKEARKAFVYALEMASLTKANILLLHAFHKPLKLNDAVRFEDAVKELEKEENTILREYATEVKTEVCKNFSLQFNCKANNDPANSQPPGVSQETGQFTASGTQFHTVQEDKRVAEIAVIKINCISKLGWAADEIITAAKNHKADLVVMGTRGAGAIRQAFLGSTVGAVIQSGKVPVLALPQNTIFKEIKSIVFACDLSKIPDITNLNTLRGWVKSFEANLTILHIYQEPERKKEEEKTLTALAILDKAFFDLNYKVYFQQQPDIAEGIQAFTESHPNDLLVLAPNQHTFLEKLLQKTVTGKITANPFLPFLTLPGPTKSNRLRVEKKLLNEQQ